VERGKPAHRVGRSDLESDPESAEQERQVHEPMLVVEPSLERRRFELGTTRGTPELAPFSRRPLKEHPPDLRFDLVVACSHQVPTRYAAESAAELALDGAVTALEREGSAAVRAYECCRACRRSGTLDRPHLIVAVFFSDDGDQRAGEGPRAI